MPADYYLFEHRRKVKVPLEAENILGRESGLKTETMSRRHVQIVTKENRWFMADLNSTNGTYLNGKKIKTREWYSLKVGDELEFGGMVFNLMGPKGREAEVEKPRAETVSQTLPRDGAATSKMSVMSAGDEKAAAPAEPAPAAESEPAGFFARVLAFAIDLAAYALAAYVLHTLFKGIPPANAALQLAAWLGMGLVCTKLLGYTLGKMMFGTRVVNDDGTPLTWRTAILREVVGKWLFLMVLPAGLLGLLTGLGGPGPVLGLLLALMLWIGVLFKLRREGAALWDVWFGTKVIHSATEE